MEYDTKRLVKITDVVLLNGVGRVYSFVKHEVFGVWKWAVFIDHIDTEQDFESIEQAMISAVAIAYGNGSKAEDLYNLAVIGI